MVETRVAPRIRVTKPATIDHGGDKISTASSATFLRPGPRLKYRMLCGYPTTLC